MPTRIPSWRQVLAITPIGWVLIGILAALAVPTALGIDLRYQLQRVIAALFGPETLYWFTAWLVQYGILWWTDPVGPAMIPALLIAGFILRARRRRASLCIVVGWAVLTPLVPWNLARPLAGWLGLSAPQGFVLSDAIDAAVFLALTRLWMRQWTPIIWAGPCVAASILIEWRLAVTTVAPSSRTVEIVYWTSPAIGKLGYTAALIAHAVNARRHACRHAHECATCGYDLRGLPVAPSCPECGVPIGVAQRGALTPGTLPASAANS